MWRFFQRRRRSGATAGRSIPQMSRLSLGDEMIAAIPEEEEVLNVNDMEAAAHTAATIDPVMPHALSFGDEMMEAVLVEDVPSVLNKKEGKARTKARKKMKKEQIERFLESVREAEHVDLCFIIDSTGSMSSHIASVKENIKQIVRQIVDTNEDLKLRLAVVAYRDFGDTKQFEVLDFADARSGLSTFETFVGNLEAKGGGDTPEDMAGAIHKANGLNWEYATRVVFLIADAPCHGTTFHNISSDNYPNGSLGFDIVSDLRVLQGTKASKFGTMTLYFGRITSLTDKMINVFKANGINVEVVNLSNVGSMASIVTSAVRRSISTTVSLTTGSSSSTSETGATTASTKPISRPYSIVARSPTIAEWTQQLAVPVKVYRNWHVMSIEDLRTPLGVGMYKPATTSTTDTNSRSSGIIDDTSMTNMLMRRSPNPFAEGEIRLAYHGQLSQCDRDLNKSESAVILKSFKRASGDGGPNDRKQYEKQMEVSNIAYFLANEYNKVRPAHCGSITFLEVAVVEECSNNMTTHSIESESTDEGNRCYCAEAPLPEGGFVRFGNNTGYWNAENLDETLLRFTLFTFTVTGGYLMLTDLQGVEKENGDFVLTDPAILCKDLLRFGNTNFGPALMMKCLKATRAHMTERGWKL